MTRNKHLNHPQTTSRLALVSTRLEYRETATSPCSLSEHDPSYVVAALTLPLLIHAWKNSVSAFGEQKHVIVVRFTRCETSAKGMSGKIHAVNYRGTQVLYQHCDGSGHLALAINVRKVKLSKTAHARLQSKPLRHILRPIPLSCARVTKTIVVSRMQILGSTPNQLLKSLKVGSRSSSFEIVTLLHLCVFE
jgi:hypothetical protein